MSLLDHVHVCNEKNMAEFMPFYADKKIIGWVPRTLSSALSEMRDAFVITSEAIYLTESTQSPAERSRLLASVVAALRAQNLCQPLRNELYSCKMSWLAPELFQLDRAAVTLFGLRAYGVHLNGWVETADGPALWIGRRALDKKVAPGKLDNMVAGGQPAGLSLRENLAKEAAEEADVPAELIAQARAVGALTYSMEGLGGLRADTMFCYDLQLPPSFQPRNTDGEMVGFELWPVQQALEVIAAGDDFKFNVNLVIIDFAIRHGVLTAENEPQYTELLSGLRSPLP